MKLSGGIAAMLFTFGAAMVEAQEIRILDPHGLTRAVQSSTEPLNVEVTVSVAEGRMLGGATLVQTSGLADDRAGVGEGRRYLFVAVPPGTWQVQVVESSERMSGVRIVK